MGVLSVLIANVMDCAGGVLVSKECTNSFDTDLSLEGLASPVDTFFANVFDFEPGDDIFGLYNFVLVF